jgi:hypothetical protein
VVAFCSSDIQSISIPAGQGGCGQAHSRDGARVWKLDCPACSAVVLGENRAKVWGWSKERGYMPGQADVWLGWSATIQNIPPTFDERLERDRTKQSGQSELERLQAMALAKTMGIPVPQALATSLGGVQALAELEEVPQLLCQQGHSNRAGARFCDTCATSMQVTGDPEGGAGDGQQGEEAA